MKKVRCKLTTGILVGALVLCSSALDGQQSPKTSSHSDSQSGRIREHLTPLMKAAADSDASAVKRLLRGGAPVNDADVDGYTALHLAAHCGEVTIVKMLLKAGANVNAKTKQGVTPLLSSIDMMCPTPGVTLALIRAGADVNDADSRGSNALCYATTESSIEVMKELLKRGADPNVLCKSMEDRPLHLSALNGFTDRVELLLEAGADPQLRNSAGQTALEVANKNYPHIRHLLEKYSGRRK